MEVNALLTVKIIGKGQSYQLGAIVRFHKISGENSLQDKQKKNEDIYTSYRSGYVYG